VSSQGAQRREVSDTSHLAGEVGGQTDAEPDSSEAIVGRILVSDHARLLSYLVGLLGNSEEAREVWQVFALRALAASGALRDRSVVRGWLSRVLATTVADHRRSRTRALRREVPLDGIDDQALVADPSHLARQAACACMHKLLPLMRPDYLEVVRRADLLLEPREQIAASLDTTVNNVAVRLHRGRISLRRLLEDTCRACDDHGHLDCGCPAPD